MRIAQVAPLYESVPPQLYGGTERVVSYLVEELVRQGHDVTLFASDDSSTTAQLVSPGTRGLRLGGTPWPIAAAHALMIEQVAQRADDYDCIHFHTDALHLSVARRLRTPSVTTLHGRLDLPGLEPLYQEFSDHPLVSISEAQRLPLARLSSWIATVYHGLPPNLYRPGDGGGGYLAFLGRISPEKRLDRAVAIARATGFRLRVAAKVDPADERYYRDEVGPLLADPLVDFIGEVGDAEKQQLLGDARALLFPIDWPEPFGLVMIEALACGTPVVAFEGGSVREVIDDGVSGFVVSDRASAVEAVRRLDGIDRRECRRIFDERFSAQHMAAGYLSVYERIIRAGRERPGLGA